MNEEIDYDAAVAASLQPNRATDARLGVMVAADTNPDAYAEAKRIAGRTGVPVDTVFNQPEEMKRQDKMGSIDFDTLAKVSPATSALLSDIEKAKIAHDDIDNLSAMESVLKFGKNAAKTAGAFPFALTEGVLGVAEAGADNLNNLINPLIPDGLLPVDIMGQTAAGIHRMRQSQSDWRKYLTPEAETNFGKGLVSGGISLFQNLPMMAAAVYTGNPTLALDSMAAMTFGQTYGEDRDKGINQNASFLHGVANGGIEKYTEMWSVGKLFSDLKAGSSLVKTMTNQLAPEIIGEQAATAMQGFNDWVVRNPDQPISEYIDTMPDAAAQTLVATLVGVGGQTAIIKGIDAMTRSSRQAQSAEQQAAHIEQVNQIAAASKVMQRDPEAMKSFIDEALANSPAQNVYIDAQSFAQSGVAEQIAASLPDVAQQLPNALATGGEIKIPMSDYVSKIAATEFAQPLVDHIRMEGEEFTRAGAKQYMDNHAEELQAEVERVLNNKQVDDSFQASTLAVKDAIKQQLTNVSRFTDKVNDHDATLVSQFYAVQAHKFGMTPEALFQRYPVTIASSSIGGNTLSQTSAKNQGDAITRTDIDGMTGGDDTARSTIATHDNNSDTILFQRRSSKRDDYTLDLFDVPAETGTAGTAAATAGSGISRDDAPAGTYGTRTQIVEENTRQLGIDTVTTPEQAAQALAYLSKSTVERFDALVTDKDGKPLAIVGAFKGAIDHATVYTATIAGEAFRINGAAHIWFAHNHPSGMNEFSAADRQLNEKLTEVFRGSEIKPRGIFAIAGAEGDGRQWVYQSEDGGDDVKGVTEKPAKATSVPVVERVYSEEGKLAKSVTAPENAKAVAKDLSNGESGVMLMDNQHAPVAFIPLKSAESETLRTDGRMDALHRGLSMANAAAAIIVNQGDMTSNAVLNLAGFFNGNQVRVLDILDKNGEAFDSRADVGLSFSRTTFNQGDGGQRGAFNPATRTITLLDKADLSTFLHESGHFFLEMQFDLATNLRKENDLVGTTEAQKQLMADTDALLHWFGLASIEEWYNLDFEQKRSYHEQFAEAFEKYLFEGKAPSLSMARLFASFRQWMMKVYEHIKDHFQDIELTDEVRQVFDRMLATEDEIQLAQQARSMMPLFADQAKSGMTPEEYADYQAAGQEATSTAMEQLALKGVRDMQWLQNARNRELKKLQRQHDELRREVRTETRGEVLAKPVYQAWDFLTRKEEGGKLDAQAVREMDLPEMVSQRLRDFNMIRTKDGLHPDVVAEMFGFTSGDQLVRAIAAAEKPKDEIERLTDERMLQNYGELSTPEAIQRAADMAIHNDVRARFITTEANALAKATGSLRILGNAAKELAEGMISRLKVRDIQPMQYSRAETKAAKAAVAASQHGDIQQAATEKRNQVLNMHLRKAAYQAEEEVEAGIGLLKRLQGAAAQGNMRGEFLLQLNALAARFDLRTSLSLKAIDENKVPLAKWVEAEADRLSAVVPDLPAFMLDENYRKHYKDMTVEEFRALLEGIKQLEFLARREQKQYLEIRKQSFDEEREAVLQVLRQNYPSAFDEEGNPLGLQPAFVPTLSKALSNVGDKTIGEFINAENIIDLLERGRMGPVFESLFSRLTHRSDWKAERLAAIYKELKPLFKAYTVKESRDFSRKGIFVEEIDTSITRENAVMVALLNGNAEGRERLANYGWGTHRINAITQHLTDKDIDLVEGIWKLFDHSLWPELKALNERTRGKAPPKVEAAPYSINGRQVSGGYMRLKYDTDLDERSHRLDEGQAVTELLGGGLGMSSKTNQGTSTQRLQGVKLRPRLDLGVFSETVAESVHDLAYREAIADTMRMLNDRRIQTAIKSAQGVPAYRALVTRVRQIAAPPRNPAGFIEKTMSVARKNTVIAMMSGVKTALQNLTGYFPALAKVPPGLLVREVVKFYSPQMVERTRFAMEQSAYMRGRFDHFDRDLQDMANKLTVNGKILPDTAVFLGLMGLVDRGVTVPVWAAAFTDGMQQHGNDHAKATDYADHIVRQTQGSGRDVDLAQIMAGHGAWGQLKKVFTMFHSYFNAQLGLLVTLGAVAKHDAKTNPVLASAKFTGQFMAVVALPAVLTELLMHGLGDDDDPEEQAKRWAKVFIRYGAGMFPLLRDVVAGFMSTYAPDSTYHAGFKLSPIESAAETAIKAPGAVYDIFTGAGTDSDIRTAIMGTGVMLGLPGKLISDTVRGTNAWLAGEAGPQAVVLGPPPKH